LQQRGDDFYLALCNGTITVTGSLTVEEAVELMQKKILLKKAMVKLSWLPSSAYVEFSAFAIMLIEKQKYLHMQKFMLIKIDILARTNILFNKKSRKIFICGILAFS
jgi:hypothetical protein